MGEIVTSGFLRFGSFFRLADGRHQAVASFREGLDDPRVPGVVLEGFAQLDDGIAHRIVADDPAAPHGGLQFLATDHLPGPESQKLQHLHDLRFELGGLVAAGNPANGRIHNPFGNTEYARWAAWCFSLSLFFHGDGDRYLVCVKKRKNVVLSR